MNTNKPIDLRQKSPQSTGAIDASADKLENGGETPGSIKTPSTDMHATKPGPGNEASGQTSKM